jgi:hypothetical protein
VASAALFCTTAGTAWADDSSDAPAPQADATSQPFLAWGDGASYELAPDGDFAQGLAGWTTSDGAGLTPGAEPWDVSGDGADQSLELPSGSSATSPETVIEADDPTIRFFATNTGDPSSTLSVAVTFTTLLGLQVSLPIDTISADSDWAPSPQVWIAVNLLAGLGSMPVQFTFTPSGAGDWQIDDLYVDPWGRT